MPSIVPRLTMQEKPTHVAVGVVENPQSAILIAQRPKHLHQGGLWEFPGGKVEPGEEVFCALRRELEEEVGITIKSADPLIQVPYHYADKSVLLDVFRIRDYTGHASGLEGQPIQWVSAKDLVHYTFPDANQAIINTLRLPERYLITGSYENTDDFLTRLRHSLQRGIRLVQLRSKQLTDDKLIHLAELSKPLCDEYQAQLLVNTRVELATQLGTGLHLSSRRLMACRTRPVSKDTWLAASVHNVTEVEQANAIGVDFIVISPVLPTDSHPGEPALGWQVFSSLVRQASVPVYALGGQTELGLAEAKRRGAQGIAAISAFWNKV